MENIKVEIINTTQINKEEINMNTDQACTDLIIREGTILEEKEQADGGIRVVQMHEECLMAQELADDEKAVESAGDFDRTEIMKKRVEIPAGQDMFNIQGVLNNCMYARIWEDGRGTRFVEYCQRYQNGNFSGRMKIRQSDIINAQRYKRSNDKRFALKRKKILEKAEEEYLGKFKGDFREVWDMEDILDVFVRTLGALPEPADSREDERWEFYLEVVNIVQNLTSQVGIRQHRHYYALREDDMDGISQRMGIRKDTLLRKLKEYNFLYLVNSSTRYKTNVKVEYYGNTSYTEWCYCLWKLEINGNSDTECLFDF